MGGHSAAGSAASSGSGDIGKERAGRGRPAPDRPGLEAAARSRLAAAEAALLAPPPAGRSDRREHIKEWLAAIGVPPAAIRTDYRTEAGPVGLYLANRRILIEVKDAGRLSKGPYAGGTGSARGETAFEEIARRVAAERSRERLYLEANIRELSWIGLVTDGRLWYAWDWQARPPDSSEAAAAADAPSRIGAWHGTELGRGNIGRLAALLGRGTVGKEWATADMSRLFEGARDALARSFQKRREQREVRVQRGLWLEQLGAGGNAPDADADAMFVVHTLLILIARTILPRSAADGDARYGLARWVDDSTMRMISGAIQGYNWSQHAGDVLRAMYRHFVPAEHRRLHGEHYTLDWLAEAMCAAAIDDAFIAEQVRRFKAGQAVQGVLDPACGSGTFLYHAAKRIAGSETVKRYLKGGDAARLACAMVRGVDIHPVAVEMARANVRRLLPGAGEADIVVYQGDSLLATRPEAALYGSGGDDLPLVSPGGRHLVLPGWFAMSSEGNVASFVESASDGADLPPSLGAEIDGYDEEALLAAHAQMRAIIRAEPSGAWPWYILNQAGPMRLRGTIGRIVGNPPWVSYDKIQDAGRKRAIRDMAGQLGLWPGGPNTKFDVAALFADRCPGLYMGASSKDGVSCWVLPRSAMESDTWRMFREKAGPCMSGTWDVGTLAFSTASCVVFLGPAGERNRRLEKRPGADLGDGDTWAAAAAKTRWARPPRPFPQAPSEWLGDGGRRPLARRGAAVIPHCLVWAASVSGTGRTVHVATKRARWQPWKGLGVLEGDVSAEWIRECVAADSLVPYMVRTSVHCILPLRGGGWDPGRETNRFWRTASGLYEAHRGIGSGSPKTLEARLDYNGMLLEQARGDAGHRVAHNKAGGAMYAARIPDDGRIVHDTLYYLRCRSRAEARFLTAVLNAEALRPALLRTRRNGMDFAAHPWRMIPIPRYDGSSRLHRTLSWLAARAERVVAGACADATVPTVRARRDVAAALRADGVSGGIDAACAELLPDHARLPHGNAGGRP